MNIVWFKRDLRIVDHRPLYEAAAKGSVLCLYIAEPDYWQLPDTSARQWLAIADGLAELDHALKSIYGVNLTIRTGNAVEVFKELHITNAITAIFSHEETGNLWTYGRDKHVAQFCKENAIDWHEYPQFGVFRKLSNRDHWAARWDAFMSQPLTATIGDVDAIEISPGRLPERKDLGLASDPCPDRQRGGRKAGLALLESFLGGRGARYQYEMSSPLTAPQACSRLSLHLATGTLSLREVFQRCEQTRHSLLEMPEMVRPISLRSLNAFMSRLHWHCHFMQKLESEPEIEARSVHPLHEADRRITNLNDPILWAWIEGRTGYPFVDACMRSLTFTGWINFRMRAMLMSFATYHLALDWAVAGAALARRFTDYEPGIHWPQVQMQAGQTGINTPRIYNPLKQSFDQDPDAIFISKWVPELARLPLAFRHEPWLISSTEEIIYDVKIVVDYPKRIVDHEVAATAARARLTGVRNSPGYRANGEKVFLKHGSRKKMVARVRAGVSKSQTQPEDHKDRQMMLDF